MLEQDLIQNIPAFNREAIHEGMFIEVWTVGLSGSVRGIVNRVSNDKVYFMTKKGASDYVFIGDVVDKKVTIKVAKGLEDSNNIEDCKSPLHQIVKKVAVNKPSGEHPTILFVIGGPHVDGLLFSEVYVNGVKYEIASPFSQYIK